MKSIIECLTINEAAAKDIKAPRKGSTIYILKDGETKAIPVKVTDIEKRKDPFYSRGGYTRIISLEDNIYDFDGYDINHWSDPGMNAPVQVWSAYFGNSLYYLGTSKEVISEYIKSRASKKLEDVLNRINYMEEELAKLKMEKDKLEFAVNSEITESLK